MEGKHTNAAVIDVKSTAITKFSSLGKKPEATIIATVHALGFKNWNRDASYNFNGLELSLLWSLKDPKILYPKNKRYRAHIYFKTSWIIGYFAPH